MSNKENIQKELEGLSPFLASIPKKEPFTMPAGYVHKMQAELAEKIRQHEKVTGFGLWERLVPQFFKIAIAAVLIVGAVVVWQQVTQEQTAPQQTAAISTEEVLEFFDEEMLIEFAHAQGVFTEQRKTYLEDYILQDLENELLFEEL